MAEESYLVRRLFVGKLPANVTEEEVKEYFCEKCAGGDLAVEKIFLKTSTRDSTGSQPFTFAYLTFRTADDLQEILLNKTTLSLKGKRLQVRTQIPRGNDEIPGADTKTNKVYITGLPRDMDQEDVKKAMKDELTAKFDTRYGTVEMVEVAIPKGETGKTKGFGFITLSSEDYADRLVIGNHKIRLMDRDMTITKCQDREKLLEAKADRGMGRGLSRGAGRGADRGGRGADRGGRGGVMQSPGRPAANGYERPLPTGRPLTPFEEDRRAYQEELQQWADARRRKDDDMIRTRLEEFDQKHAPAGDAAADMDLPPQPQPRYSGGGRDDFAHPREAQTPLNRGGDRDNLRGEPQGGARGGWRGASRGSDRGAPRGGSRGGRGSDRGGRDRYNPY